MFGLSTNDTIILAAVIAVHAVAVFAYFRFIAALKRSEASRSAKFRALLDAIPDDDDQQHRNQAAASGPGQRGSTPKVCL